MRTGQLFALTVVGIAGFLHPLVGTAQDGSLDPRGKVHFPIGIANTLDALKTFVEAEGNFSPGFGSYGIYFWVFDSEAGKLTAPTMGNVECSRGLSREGYLIPWSSWKAGDVQVETEVCEVKRPSPAGEVFVVGTRASLTNAGGKQRRLFLYVVLRPLGAAGWAVKNLTVGEDGASLLVDGHAALVSEEKPSRAGVLSTDTIGALALKNRMPTSRSAASQNGDCSGALRFDLTMRPGEKRRLGFVCPVLPGRRAVGHRWDGKSTWAQLDEAEPNPAQGGLLQPDPGVSYYRELKADELFDEAAAYWEGLAGRASIEVPDGRWGECFVAIVGHVGMCLNDGAPDVAVVNYNVFNRDGVYEVNVLQKSGLFELAAEGIDYFLAHPFSGRVYPEADNPGQILWVMGEQWLFTRDREWLRRVYPSVQKLAAMIKYYRTTEGPHWVCSTSLDFGEVLPVEKRQELKPGGCDGYHPEYTEAFDIAGLRKAVVLAEGMGNSRDAEEWKKLADSFFETYDRQFGAGLAKDYGSYSVLWPCHLYSFTEGKAHEQFKNIGARKPAGWRYFPLATAHQGLLTGNRDAGYGTLEAHLEHEQMRRWYLLDEGGASGPGGWRHVRTRWSHGVAMPHGWAIAELWLLMRDSFLFEDDDRLVLFSGLPTEWFTQEKPIAVHNLPTHFGSCSFTYAPCPGGAMLTLSGTAAPPGGHVLRLPRSLKVRLKVGGKALVGNESGCFLLPRGARSVEIEFAD